MNRANRNRSISLWWLALAAEPVPGKALGVVKGGAGSLRARRELGEIKGLCMLRDFPFQRRPAAGFARQAILF